MSDLLEDPDRLILVDGSGYIFRAYHVMPPMNRPDGTPVNAVRGFCQMLVKLLDDFKGAHLAVIFDAGRFSFRNDLYDAYKANRPEPPEDLVPQFPLTREASRAFNLPTIAIEGFEADDVIATYARLAREAGRKVTIVSSDKDLMQLVTDDVAMWDPMKNTAIFAEQVREKFGVDPDRVVDVQALAGDSVDNVPGVPGIGVKTAAQLIAEHGDLETLLARAGEIKQTKRRENLITHADDARLSLKLVTLRDDAPVDPDLDALARKPMDAATTTAFLEENAFKTLLARLRTHWGAAETPAVAAPVTAEYELVTDLDALKRWIAAARREGVVAVDTETTALNAMRAELVGVSLATHPGRACYIPLDHVDDLGVARQQIPMADALAALKPLLEDASVLKIGQNLKYDMTVLAEHAPAITIHGYDDTMVLSYILDGAGAGHGMDELAQRHLGLETIKYEAVCGKGKAQIPFSRVPLDRALAYAAEDADITLRLWRLLKKRLVAERAVTVYESMDRPLIGVLCGMERRGILCDRAELARLSADFGGRIEDLTKQVHILAGKPFNIGSPKQLGEILFDALGLPRGKKTKTGWSTDSSTLEPLAAEGHEIVARVLDWRRLSKLKSTYADALLEDINPKTGRVHTRFSQTVASTGRLSSNDPNLQNIPIRTEEGRRIRAAFTAPDGHVLLSCDYSQIELRLAAEIAGVSALKQAFADGRDIHGHTAAQVFDLRPDQVDKESRAKAKAINFGIIYGISGYGLSSHLNVTPGEAKAYIDHYLDRLPELRDWLEQTKVECRKTGAVSTPFGRRIRINGINDKNPNMRGFAERQAINAPIQGAAADVMKRAMRRVEPALAAAKLDARLLLQVHDELVFETPEDQVEETAAVVKRVMERAAEPACAFETPLLVEAGWAKSWAEAH